MILQEIERDRFLPVYVQDYHRQVRWPMPHRITKESQRLTVHTGMEHSGTGHFQQYYKISLRPNRRPVVEVVKGER